MKYVVVAIIIFCFQFEINSVKAVNNNKNDTRLKRLIKPNLNNVTAEKTVLSFLRWYKNNQERLQKISVVNGIPGDSTKLYKVDFEKVKEFLKELKESGYVSDKYNSTLMAIFKKSDYNFKLHPQSDGLVSDLEFDIISGVQEQTDITEHLNDIKILSKKMIGNKSSLILGIGKHLRLNVNLSKYNNRWLIDTYKATYL